MGWGWEGGEREFSPGMGKCGTLTYPRHISSDH